MCLDDTIELTKKLISIPSLSGSEQEILSFLEDYFEKKNWRFNKIPVSPGRDNLFVAFGRPKIVFTTHIDVVPGKADQFFPTIKENKLYGRGACDAKGIAATMISVCNTLQKRGKSNFGLLIVVEEETSGLGARVAAEALKDSGISYLVNGEPTENKIASAHKGALGFKITLKGKSCHSGYPELGIDANRNIILLAKSLLDADFGSNSTYGSSTINIGEFSGGTAANVISNLAMLSGNIRTVQPNCQVIAKLEKLIPEDAKLLIDYNVDPTKLFTLSGFESEVFSYCTDIPNFKSLNANCLMYGPGSIHNAHTEDEFITFEDINLAINDYQKIFSLLEE